RGRTRAAIDQAVHEWSEYEVEFRCVWPDGTIHWLSARGRALPTNDSRPARVVGVTLDITGRKQSEEQLREANRRKDDVLATLAHELRNPLAPISNAVEVMALTENLPPAIEELREVMARQVRQLVRLLDDLLDVSRITSGKVELRKQPVELATVVASAL